MGAQVGLDLGRVSPSVERTGEDGAFRLSFVHSGQHQIHVDLPGLRLLLPDTAFSMGSDPIRNLLVQLPRGGEVRGQILECPNPQRVTMLLQQRKEGAFQPRGFLNIKPDGSFGGEHLPAGRWRLVVTSQSGGADPLEFDLIEGDVKTVNMEWWSNPELEYRLRRSEGSPVRDRIMVLASPPPGQPGKMFRFSLVPDESGRAFAEALPPGHWVLQVRTLAGTVRRTVHVLRRNNSPVEIELE